jgi:pyruvate dehydrogenase E2 component (dihydrolipoamide acetyltransferase)
MSRARERLARLGDAGLPGITYTHVILRAMAAALREHLSINRLWLEEGPSYRSLARADVGLAVAGEDTVLVLTIPEPDSVAPADLVALVDAAVRRGRAGSLTADDAAPAAITLSNLGMHGVDSFQAIVHPAQTAILAAGRVAERVVVIDGGIHVVPQMELSLTVDHRVADGVAAARFLEAVRTGLES